MRVDDFFSNGDDLVDDIDSSIDKEMDQLELMGCGIDSPELMGKVFGRLIRRIRKRRKGKKGLIRRIVSRIKKRKRARGKRGKAPADYGLSVFTPEGRADIGPGAVSFQNRAQVVQPGFMTQAPATGGIMDEVAKNPMLLAIPAGLIMMFMMKQKSSPVK